MNPTRLCYLPVLSLFFAAGNALASGSATTNALSLEQALARASTRHAGLQAAQFGLTAAEANQQQAAALPNPTFAAEVENVGGDGEAEGFDAAETTLGFSQRLEVGGQRSLRRQRARAERDLALTDLDSQRREVTRLTRQRVTDAQAAQRRLVLRTEALQLALRMAEATSQRVQAGKDAPVEAAKARAELARAQAALDRTRGEVAGCYRALAALWGAPAPDFDSVTGELGLSTNPVPDLATLEAALLESPAWTRAEHVLLAADQDLAAERAARIPDVSVGLGFRHEREESADSYLAGIEFDLPLFDRRQGGIAAAHATRARIQAEQEAARTALRLELASLHQSLVVARQAALTLEQEALPAATEAFTAAEAAYRAGKIGYLDAQDARHALLEVQAEWIDAVVEYQHAEAALDCMVGISRVEAGHVLEGNK